MCPPMAVNVSELGREVANQVLDVRPGQVQRIYGKRKAPLSFERLAIKVLSEPCGCDMCKGILKARDRRQVANLRNDLAKNRFKRAVVMCRDSWKCRACGSEDELTIDHVRGLAIGGTNAYHNLQVLCLDCHLGKPDSHEPRYLARHLANLVDRVLVFAIPETPEDHYNLKKVRRMIDLIRKQEVA